MSRPPFFLHVGLPRTATTTLQGKVFPALQGVAYLGKTYRDPRVLLGQFNPLELVKQAQRSWQAGAPPAPQVQALLPTLVKMLKVANQFSRTEKSRELLQALNISLAGFRQALPAMPLLYSDESLIEGIAGLSSDISHGAAVPLEQLGEMGALSGMTVLLVLREPVDYLRASWYKNNEYLHQDRQAPLSFDTWVRKQIALYVHQPSASRIFQAMQASFVRHVRSYCPDVVVSHYEDLQAADDLLGTLTGGRWKTPGLSLTRLPRENSSFRSQAVVDFMLSAPGVPPGITMAEYVQTFEATLRHYEIHYILQAERLRAASRAMAA